MNYPYRLNTDELKSMTAIKFEHVNFESFRTNWESMHGTILRLFGNFFDVRRYGLKKSIADQIKLFETAQLVNSTSTAFLIDEIKTKKIEDILDRVKAFRAANDDEEYGAMIEKMVEFANKQARRKARRLFVGPLSAK